MHPVCHRQWVFHQIFSASMSSYRCCCCSVRFNQHQKMIKTWIYDGLNGVHWVDDELQHTMPVHALNRAAVVVVLQQLFRLGSAMMHLSAHTYFAMVQSSYTAAAANLHYSGEKFKRENIYDWVMRSNAVVVVVSTRVCVLCSHVQIRGKKEHQNRLLKIQRMELLPLMTTVSVSAQQTPGTV